MKIAILGTGMVGNAIGSKLVDLGHQVMMGSRSADSPKAREWKAGKGQNALTGTYADAAKFGDILFNCTKGEGSVAALKLAGVENIKAKILVDIANPLDFSQGMPPSLFIVNTDSLGETLQRAFPEIKVVKTLNTMNCNLMVNPSMIRGDHSVFICGNDNGAKEQVSVILKSFGWQNKNIIDLGDITSARATEQLLPVWIRLMGKFQHPNFNFQIVT